MVFKQHIRNRSYFLINRPTRVAILRALLIGKIFTNCVFDTSLKKGIIKTSISDHFEIFAAIKLSNEKTENRKIKVKIFLKVKSKIF